MIKVISEPTLRAIAFGLTLSVAAACNSVLGIESAQLEQATSESLECQDLYVPPVESCGTTSECEGCLSRCGAAEIQSCVDDRDCRSALLGYRGCVGDDCEDTSGRCAECLGLEASGAECLAGCAVDCEGSELVSLCELFCACMQANCGGPATDQGPCLDSCSETPVWELECVLSHCELAPFNADHCMHARHQPTRQCPLTAPEADSEPGCGSNKALIGYGCEENSDCCSRFCDHGTCR